MSTYVELLEQLKQLPEESLTRDVIVYDTFEDEFRDLDYNTGKLNVSKADEKLSDDYATYFIM